MITPCDCACPSVTLDLRWSSRYLSYSADYMSGEKTNLQLRVLAVVLAVLIVLPAAALAQSTIGVLGIAEEIAPIEKRLQGSREVVVRGYVFRLGTLEGRQVVVGRSGAGKVNAAIITTLLIGQFNPSAILFSGTAGAVDPALRPGDVVIGQTVAQHDVGLQTPNGIRRRGMRNAVTGALDPLLVPAPETLLAAARRSAQGLTLPPIKTSEGDRVPRIVEGVIVTGDVFLADAERREELRRTLGATAIEMEGAAVVQTCRQFSVSCLVVRSVTDRADTQALTDYEQFLAAASANAVGLVTAIITRLEVGAR
jgi:adenosylhomocysteine nucleosidase